MSVHRVVARVMFYVELTENDDVSDHEYDAILDGVIAAVRGVTRVYDEDVRLITADITPVVSGEVAS